MIVLLIGVILGLAAIVAGVFFVAGLGVALIVAGVFVVALTLGLADVDVEVRR